MSRLKEFFQAGGVELEIAGEGADIQALQKAAQSATPHQSYSTSTGAAMTTIIRPST